MEDCVAKGRQARGKKLSAIMQKVVARGDAHGLRKHPERVARGEKHYRAKLKAKDVIWIRKHYAKGTVTQQSLANKYGVSFGLISQIVRGRCWKMAHA